MTNRLINIKMSSKKRLASGRRRETVVILKFILYFFSMPTYETLFFSLSLSLQLLRVQRSSKDDNDRGKTDFMLDYPVCVIHRTYFLIAI